MRWRLVISCIAALLVLERTYSLGKATGLKSAPEYLQAKREQAERHDAFWAEMAELETPEDKVCEQIFVMVDELRAASVLIEPERID